MERDCQARGTPIALREGLSVPIEQLSSNSEQVLGWTGQGVEKSKQTNFAYKGVLPKYTITLQDGRQIHATRDHPLLIESGDWIELHNIMVGERLTCSVNPPLADFEKESIEVRKWLRTRKMWGKSLFRKIKKESSLSDHEIFRRWLILARLVAWAMTDGHIPEKGRIHLFFGHLLDVGNVSDDIERITDVRLPWKMNKNSYEIVLPSNLSDIIREFGMCTGSRVENSMCLPDFIDEETPLCIIREFLGGLFGGDGHTVCLSQHRGKRDLMKSVAISWARNTPESLKSLIGYMENIQKLLERCGVHGSTINAPKLTSASKKSEGKKIQKEVVLAIPLESLTSFSEKIGFRYCVHKTQRLDAGVSYRRFREGVLRQRQWIIDRANEICNYSRVKQSNGKKIFVNPAIIQAIEELEQIEPILHTEAIPTSRMFERIVSGKSKNEIRSTTFPTVEKYLTDVGAIRFFSDDGGNMTYGVDRESTVIPPYYLKVIDIRESGVEEMYDITVEKAESFVANGVVSHNCLIGQGAPCFAKDRLMEQSDETRVWFCRVCGLQALVTAGDTGKRILPRRECRVCDSNNVTQVKIPYATKLLIHELAAMNVIIRALATSYGEPGDAALIVADGKGVIGKGMIVK